MIKKLIATLLKLNFLKESKIKNKNTRAKNESPVHFILVDKQPNVDAKTKNQYDFLEPCGESLKHKTKYKDKNPKNNKNISIKINFDWTKIALSHSTISPPKKAAFLDKPIFKIK